MEPSPRLFESRLNRVVGCQSATTDPRTHPRTGVRELSDLNRTTFVDFRPLRLLNRRSGSDLQEMSPYRVRNGGPQLQRSSKNPTLSMNALHPLPHEDSTRSPRSRRSKPRAQRQLKPRHPGTSTFSDRGRGELSG